MKTADPVLMAEVSFGMYCCRRGKAPRLPLSFTCVVNGLVLLLLCYCFNEKGDATMQRPCAYAKMGVRISCMLSLPELLQLMLLLERASNVEAFVLTSSDDLRIA